MWAATINVQQLNVQQLNVQQLKILDALAELRAARIDS
jgi:hypothetical protein